MSLKLTLTLALLVRSAQAHTLSSAFVEREVTVSCHSCHYECGDILQVSCAAED